MQRRASGEDPEGGGCFGNGVRGRTMRSLLLYVESVKLKYGIILYFGTHLKQETILSFGAQL